jgi:hypothetical protein
VSALEYEPKVTTGNPYIKPQRGNDYVGVLAQWCLETNTSNQQVQVSTFPWTLRFPDGTGPSDVADSPG